MVSLSAADFGRASSPAAEVVPVAAASPGSAARNRGFRDRAAADPFPPGSAMEDHRSEHARWQRGNSHSIRRSGPSAFPPTLLTYRHRRTADFSRPAAPGTNP